MTDLLQGTVTINLDPPFVFPRSIYFEIFGSRVVNDNNESTKARHWLTACIACEFSEMYAHYMYIICSTAFLSAL